MPCASLGLATIYEKHKRKEISISKHRRLRFTDSWYESRNKSKVDRIFTPLEAVNLNLYSARASNSFPKDDPLSPTSTPTTPEPFHKICKGLKLC